MKRKIAMLLCLVIVLSVGLLGCSGGSDPLVGTWNGTMDLAELLNSALAADAEFGEYLQVSSFALAYNLVFEEDGTYSMTIDDAALDQEMERVKGDLESGLYAYLDDLIAEEGLTLTSDELLNMSGVSMEELMDAALSEEMIDQLLGDLNMEGNFKAEDGKLFLSSGLDSSVDENVYDLYTLDGDTLTIDAGTASSENEMSQYVYPMVFTKAG